MADYGSLSKPQLLGRICRVPKSRDTQKGTKVAWFSIITKRIFPGDREPRPDYHRVICFGKRAEYMLDYGRLGRLFFVEGWPNHRAWIDNEGKQHSIHEVIAEQTIAMEPYRKAEPKAPEKEGEKKQEEPADEIETYPFDDEDPLG